MEYKKIDKKKFIIGEFHEGRAVVTNKESKKKEKGFINEAMELVIPCIYEVVWNFNNGMAKVKISDDDFFAWGVIDPEGKDIIPAKYHKIEFLDNKHFKVYLNKKWGIKDIENKFLVAIKYDWIKEWSEGTIIVKNSELYGVLNENGKEIIPIEYPEIKPCSEGLFAVRNERKWGYINKENEIVFPFEYEDAWSFSNGKAQVKVTKFKTIIVKGKHIK